MPTVGSLFSGIGGLDLGLERAGWTVRWQVEIDPFCQRVLAKHWPDVPRFGDVTTLTGAELERVDLIAGGFPCQPVSVAGKRLAQDDARWLWPEFARLVRVVRPRLVLVENVPGLLHRGMGDVVGDLATCGYDAEWDGIPASAVGAPHRRDRVWLVAYPIRPALRHESGRGHGARWPGASESRHDGPAGPLADADGGRCQECGIAESSRLKGPHRGQPDGRGAVREQYDGEAVADANDSGCREQRRVFTAPTEFAAAECVGWWRTEPNVGRVAHGVPARVDRLRGLGNAVVPQVAEWLGRRLMDALTAPR